MVVSGRMWMCSCDCSTGWRRGAALEGSSCALHTAAVQITCPGRLDAAPIPRCMLLAATDVVNACAVGLCWLHQA